MLYIQLTYISKLSGIAAPVVPRDIWHKSEQEKSRFMYTYTINPRYLYTYYASIMGVRHVKMKHVPLFHMGYGIFMDNRWVNMGLLIGYVVGHSCTRISNSSRGSRTRTWRWPRWPRRMTGARRPPPRSTALHAPSTTAARVQGQSPSLVPSDRRNRPTNPYY